MMKSNNGIPRHHGSENEGTCFISALAFRHRHWQQHLIIKIEFYTVQTTFRVKC